MSRLLSLLLCCSLFSPLLPAAETNPQPETPPETPPTSAETLRTAVEGMLFMASTHSVNETAVRLENLIQNKGLTLFARIDHTAGAAKVDLTLRPTVLFIFGNPKVGTPLMQCQQTVGLDLPQKILIWEDEQGKVWLSYNDPLYIQQRHNLTDCGREALDKISVALSRLAREAGVKGTP